jgi:hypothetical protein
MRLRLRLRNDPGVSGTAAMLGIRVLLKLAVARVDPLAVDVLRGDRSGRAQPLLYREPGAKAGSGQYLLKCTEEIRGDRQWRLQANLDEDIQSNSGAQKSLLIGEQPFTIQRFYSTPLDMLGGVDSATIASYDRGWKFRQPNGLYHYVLPPQVIGERMDKPRRLELQDANVGTKFTANGFVRPIDGDQEPTLTQSHRRAVEFRLTPAAHLWIQPADVERNYVLPEWAAGDLFSQRGELGLGCALTSLHGEFLYSLAFGVTPKLEQGAARMQPFPTHTQRHLALLFSEMRSGLGRPLERPTALYMLGSNSLQGISGVVPDVKNGRVRVVEFETPAIIIGRSAVSIPDQYKFGYLDLVAPGIAVPPASGARTLLSLNMRLVANLEARSRVVELRLGLRPESTKTSEVGVLELKSTSVSEWATFGVDLSVDGTGKVQVLAAWAVDRDGMRQAVDAQWLGIPWNTDAMQGLVMTVEPAKFKDGLDRELWLEVAMLATSLTEGNSARHGFNSTLDLDWFFGADPLSPDTAASKDALRGLHVVQARIISVSPLISMNG